jgi:methanogenic corrinoid protein MtbC1
VIDLGVDVNAEKFLNALNEHPDAWIGMSALLTTTMVNMEANVKAIKEKSPETKVYVGGAPLSAEFNKKIGADGYFPDPHSFAKHLLTLM